MAIIPKGKHVKVMRNTLNVREGVTHTLSETWTGKLSRDFDTERRYSRIWLEMNPIPIYEDTKVEAMN